MLVITDVHAILVMSFTRESDAEVSNSGFFGKNAGKQLLDS